MKQYEWEEVEKAVRSGVNVTLCIDGYEVTLKPVKYNGFSTAILPFVNGEYKSEWLLKDCPQRRRFYHVANIRLQGFREIEDCRAIWTSFELMKKHFENNNGSIELLKR